MNSLTPHLLCSPPLYPEISPNFYIPLIAQLNYEGLILCCDLVRITKKLKRRDSTKKTNGNQVRMSEILRIRRTTLQNKLVKYNITKTNISTTEQA